MNILYHFRTRGSGAEGVHISGIANALEQLGHSVSFSSPTGVDPRSSAGNDPFSDNRRNSSFLSRCTRAMPGPVFELLEMAYNVSAYLRNRRMIRKLSPAVIYERHAFFLCSTGWLAKRHRIPLVVEVNEIVGDERIRRQPLFSAVARWSDRQIFRRADLIVVVSPHLKRRIVEQGIPPEKILVLPNGVDAAAYSVPADSSAVRAKYTLPNCLVIGFVGWLVHWHHLEDLFSAFADLRATHQNLRMLVVGDGPLRSSLLKQAEDAGVAQDVRVTGPVPHAEVPAHIAAMDIAVIPHSNAYRSPIKLFEYMGQGKAVVAPATEPIAMVTHSGENGLLFEPGNLAGMRQALSQLLDSPDIRSKIGKRAREDVMAFHTWSRNAEAILTQLQSQIGKSPGE